MGLFAIHGIVKLGGASRFPRKHSGRFHPLRRESILNVGQELYFRC